MDALTAVSLLERSRAESFFFARFSEAYAKGWGDAPSGRRPRGAPETVQTATWIHEQLLDATVNEVLTSSPRRRLAISTPGVPVVYSYKATLQRERGRFRMLVEPGGNGSTVAEQVGLSRELLCRISDRLGWQPATARIDTVLGMLLPSDPKAVANWHGGLGFGLEVDDEGLELRLYCNVRHGELPDRWQRFTNAFVELTDDRGELALREVLAVAGPRTVPAGLALALRDAEVRGLRLYCGLLQASSDSAIAAAPPGFAESGPTIRRFVESYLAAFGSLAEQDITLGYDFAARKGSLVPSVVRYKVDLWSEGACGRDHERLMAWVDDQVEALGLNGSGLRSFLDDLDRIFESWTLQYVSLGCRPGTAELTAYCIPGWRASE